MRKRFSIAIIAILVTITLAFFPTGSAFAQLADGTYDLPYSVKEAGNNNVSIADGYFSKPAKLIVKNGEKHVQMTIKEANYVKSLSNTSVVSDNGNTRVVQMKVNDLSQPVSVSMHIVVPEEVAGMPYDHDHTARFVFDASGLGSNTSSGNATESGAATTGDSVENPPTGDSTSIGLYVALLFGSIVVFSVYKLRFAKD